MDYRIDVKQIWILVGLFMATSCGEQSLEDIARMKQKDIVAQDRVYFQNALGIFNYSPSQDYLDRNRQSALKNAEPWLSNNLIDTADFLDFVLPHQVNNVTGENWRDEVLQKIPGIQVTGRKISPQMFIDYCNEVNNLLKKDIRYGQTTEDETFYRYTDYGIKKGTCIAMSDYATYSFRALGIPVSKDFTPVWGNLNAAAHTWNRLLMKGGSLAFMGAESGIEDYQPLVIIKANHGKEGTYKLPPKVYRYARYSRESSDFFGNKVVDVTEEYVKVRDVVVQRPRNEVDDIYLSTFNGGKYIINARAEKEGTQALFKKMAIGLVYFPIKLEGATPAPVDYPIVCGDGRNIIMKPDLGRPITITMTYLSSPAQAQFDILGRYGYGFLETHDIHDMDMVCPKPVAGKIYELFYWDFGWKLHAKSLCRGKNLIFTDVPGNGIYIAKQESSPLKNCRPFSYVSGKINWF